MTTRVINLGPVRLGGRQPLALIAGPCVIESRAGCLALAARLARLAAAEKIPLVFKASYDKANRTSHASYRGPGLSKGLEILREVKERYGLPVLTDVHSEAEVPLAAQVADVLQLPAFLCRQTDLVLALGASGCVVNIKKGQFLAPWDVRHVIAKLESTGNRKILVTERGVSFGYNNLVADLRSLPLLRAYGYPVIFDATHSVQLPGGAGDRSGGDGRFAPALARAAVAMGCDGVFLETHVNPAQALSDAANAIPVGALPRLWRQLRAIDRIVRPGTRGGGTMRARRKRKLNGAGAAAVILCVAAWMAWAQAPEFLSVAGVRIPSYNDKGQLVSQLFGDLAKSLPDGNVEITGLKVEFYEGTQVNMRVTAPVCIFNRAQNTAQSDGPVRITRDKMVVTGTGFEFNNKDERFVIHKDAKVVLMGARKDLKQGMVP